MRIVKSTSAKSEATMTRHFEFDDEQGYYSDASPIKPQRLMRDKPHLWLQSACQRPIEWRQLIPRA